MVYILPIKGFGASLVSLLNHNSAQVKDLANAAISSLNITGMIYTYDVFWSIWKRTYLRFRNGAVKDVTKI